MKSTYLLSILILGLIFSCSKDQEDDIPPTPEPQGSDFIKVFHDEFDNKKIVLAGSPGKNFILSFERMLLDSTVLDFESTNQPLPVLMVDNEGNSWDVFGRAVDGPRIGTQLTPTRSCMGYWFAFNALYPGAEIYNGPSVELPGGGIIEADPGWTIPTDYILNAIGFGVVPSLDYPPFIVFNEEDDFYLNDNDLIVGFANGNEAKAFPHAVLDWHEVINEQVGGKEVSVLYCPLTGTAQIWEQQIDGQPNSFGVSGLLYNSNLMPFDVATESIWTQLGGKCVNGELSGAKANTLPFIETSWKTWREIYNQPLVVSEDTGADRDYRSYPYGNYKTNHDYIAYPIEYQDDRIMSKERVHGVIVNSKVKVYRFSDF